DWEYFLTVSAHQKMQLTEKKVDIILERASQLLTQSKVNYCGVTFKRHGRVGVFASAPDVIENASDLESVHRVPTDVKVVRRINFCAGQRGSFLGCAWRPEGRPKTVIVTLRGGASVDPTLWLHEFAHTTGLQHRNVRRALMKCSVAPGNKLINHE